MNHHKKRKRERYAEIANSSLHCHYELLENQMINPARGWLLCVCAIFKGIVYLKKELKFK
jgi:hypothetical protein